MKAKVFRYSSLIAATIFVLVFFGLAIFNTPGSTAVKATDFQAGRIIDDSIFFNKDAMTVAEIQAHLDRYLPTCDMWGTGAVGSGRTINGVAVPASTTRAAYAKMMYEAGNTKYHDPPYVCLNKYYENPTTHENSFDTKGEVKDGMISAAQIIYNEAQTYGVNPQVLLVMIKKESYVWGDVWPLRWEYNTVMGFGCPDTAPCNTDYYGFYNQIHMAARQFTLYKKYINAGYYNYKPFKTNYIYYSPTYSCGQKAVYIENFATAFLYIYTPYTPNNAALQNYPGTASCGSYGNRNFFMYFSEWFGTTLETFTKAKIEDGEYQVTMGERALKIGNLEKFYFEANERDEYKINNTVLGLSIDEATEGATVKAANINGQDTQLWTLIKNADETYSIIPVNASTLAVTYDAASQSYKLAIFAKNNNQKFRLTLVEKPTEEPEDPTTPNGETPEQPGGTTTDEPSGQESTSTAPLVSNPVHANQTIADGKYVFISKINDSSALQAYGGGTANYTDLSVYAGNGSKAQQFNVKFNSSTNHYEIVTVDGGKYLDVKANNASNGGIVMINQEIPSCGQNWLINKNEDGSFTIASGCDENFVLNVTSTTAENNAKVQLYARNNTTAQKFSIVVASDATTTTPSEPSTPETPATPSNPSSPSHPNRIINDGTYQFVSTINNVSVIQTYGGGTANNTGLVIYKNANSNAQKFQVKYNSYTGHYNIIAVNSNKYLDIKDGTKNGGAVIINKENARSCGQNWKFVKNDDGSYSILNGCSHNFAVDVTGLRTVNNTKIQLYRRNNTKAQRFSLIDTATGTATPVKPENQTIDDGVYNIVSAINDTSSIQTLNRGTDNYTGLVIYKNAEGDAQKFKFVFNKNTNYYSIIAVDSNKYLDVKDNNAKNAGVVMINKEIASCGQNWLVKKISSDIYSIYTACNTNYAIDVTGLRTINNTKIQLYQKNNTKAQQFKLIKAN